MLSEPTNAELEETVMAIWDDFDLFGFLGHSGSPCQCPFCPHALHFVRFFISFNFSFRADALITSLATPFGLYGRPDFAKNA